ncbi:MAG: sugar ABC transporter permease [Chloroflexi bacterium]|nr:sugar ABC transporter permease [Chloroflexota bacterium]
MSITDIAGSDAPRSLSRDRPTLLTRLNKALPFEILCILPALIATLLVIVVPLLYSLGISFYRYILTDPANIRFIGFANYVQAFGDSSFVSALRTTAVFTIGTVAAQFVLGMVFALVVHNLSFGQGLVRTAMLVPIFMTPAVAAFMWRFMLHPDLGIVNYFVSMVGLGKPVWLGNPSLALFAVMAVDIWRNTPFMFLIFLAGMQSLPSELYEAAAVDGASPAQRFLRITLPLLTPLIMVALIIRGMDAVREFDILFIMTGGGPGNATETIALATHRYSFRVYNMGLGSAVSYIIFVVVFVASIFFVRRMQRSQAD